MNVREWKVLFKPGVIGFLLFILFSGDIFSQQPARNGGFTDIYPDTWAATDGIGRAMPDYKSVGEVKTDQRRIVGIFYITWHTQGLADMKSPYEADVTKILQKAPEERLDAKHPLWTESSYHWGEP